MSSLPRDSGDTESRIEKDTELSPAERARILRKLDVHLLPFVSLLYLLSFL